MYVNQLGSYVIFNLIFGNRVANNGCRGEINKVCLEGCDLKFLFVCLGCLDSLIGGFCLSSISRVEVESTMGFASDLLFAT